MKAQQEGILGVLGGMGPQATNTFYQRIIDRTQAETDQEHLRVLIWSDAKIPDRTAGILGTPDQAEAVYAALLAGAKLLEGAGCTVLAIPCNTSHYFADRLQAQLHIPIIHMIRETVAAIQAMGKKTVGILATDGTVQTGIYQKELTAAGLTPVTLPERLQKTVMSIIYDEIKRGETGSREKFGEWTPGSARPAATAPSWAARAVGLPGAPQPAPLLHGRHGGPGRAGHPRCGKQLRNV